MIPPMVEASHAAKSSHPIQIVIVGGGAAGFFAAIACAERNPQAQVSILEKGPQFLSKVRISGGGRCNVTHHCFDTREFAARYPRGERNLLSPLSRFQARDTLDWFQARGVALKAESDGRMFPTTDSSQTIIDCLVEAARRAQVKLVTHEEVKEVKPGAAGGFVLALGSGRTIPADRLLMATGGCRGSGGGHLVESLGHSMEPSVPSLFTLHVEVPWVRDLAGLSVAEVEVSVPGMTLKEWGPILLTHWGLSGPVILRLSAWGARLLHACDYRFPVRIDWLPGIKPEALAKRWQTHREHHGTRSLVNTPFPPLPSRLWEQLVIQSALPRETRWADMSRTRWVGLEHQLKECELPVTGKSLNKDEFVTCGGVKREEVNFKTMESRLCPGLYLAGELLDVDGITGGFNFQAAWTTGWIAGNAMAD